MFAAAVLVSSLPPFPSPEEQTDHGDEDVCFGKREMYVHECVCVCVCLLCVDGGDSWVGLSLVKCTEMS